MQDGAIVAGTFDNKIARNEFLCTTRTFGDFELRLKVKLLGGDQANAGIQFRTKRIPNDHEVSGYQADMGVGWWGALYDESRRNKVLIGPDQAKMKGVIKADDWNDYVVRAEGKHVQLWINGFQTVDYMEEDPRSKRRGSSPSRFTLAHQARRVPGHHDRRSDEVVRTMNVGFVRHRVALTAIAAALTTAWLPAIRSRSSPHWARD